MKRIISFLLVLTMLSAAVVFAEESALTVTDSKFDISGYTENEIFVMYKDDTSEVITFSDEEEFENYTYELSENENVLLFRPNYSYSAILQINYVF